MWTQMVGKIKLALTPLINHWWNVSLRVSPRGLTTGAVPYLGGGFEMEFDFIDHQLLVRCDDGASRSILLAPRSVADFYREVMETLRGLGIAVAIWPMPVEVQNPIRFDQDHEHTSYDAAYAAACWRILESTANVLQKFRARFIGKCSPV